MNTTTETTQERDQRYLAEFEDENEYLRKAIVKVCCHHGHFCGFDGDEDNRCSDLIDESCCPVIDHKRAEEA